MEILQKHDFLSGLRYGSSVICQFVKMMFAKMVFADLKTIVSMIIHLISAVSKNANTFWWSITCEMEFNGNLFSLRDDF